MKLLQPLLVEKQNRRYAYEKDAFFHPNYLYSDLNGRVSSSESSVTVISTSYAVFVKEVEEDSENEIYYDYFHSPSGICP